MTGLQITVEKVIDGEVVGKVERNFIPFNFKVINNNKSMNQENEGNKGKSLDVKA